MNSLAASAVTDNQTVQDRSVGRHRRHWLGGLISKTWEQLSSFNAVMLLIVLLGMAFVGISRFNASASIEDIRVGMRVPAANPQLADEDRRSQAFEVDPKTWRTFKLAVEKQDGTGALEVTLLRPASYHSKRDGYIVVQSTGAACRFSLGYCQ